MYYEICEVDTYNCSEAFSGASFLLGIGVLTFSFLFFFFMAMGQMLSSRQKAILKVGIPELIEKTDDKIAKKLGIKLK